MKDIPTNPWLLLGLWLFGVTLWWMPSDTFGDVEVAAMVQKNHGWIGIFTLGTFSLLAATVVRGVWVKIEIIAASFREERKRNANQKRQDEEERQCQLGTLAYLETLSDGERNILSYCQSKGIRTLSLRYCDAVPRALSDKGLMVAHSGVGDQLRWPHTIPDFVWNHLNAQNVELVTAEMRQKKDWERNRESYVRSSQGSGF